MQDCDQHTVSPLCGDAAILPQVANADARCTADNQITYTCKTNYQWQPPLSGNVADQAVTCEVSADSASWPEIQGECTMQGKGLSDMVRSSGKVHDAG